MRPISEKTHKWMNIKLFFMKQPKSRDMKKIKIIVFCRCFASTQWSNPKSFTYILRASIFYICWIHIHFFSSEFVSKKPNIFWLCRNKPRNIDSTLLYITRSYTLPLLIQNLLARREIDTEKSIIRMKIYCNALQNSSSCSSTSLDFILTADASASSQQTHKISFIHFSSFRQTWIDSASFPMDSRMD